jgi:hypothetical protein
LNSKFLLACALIIAGCGSTTPTIQTGPDAQVSYDGLHLVNNSNLQQVWVDPDINFARYNKIMPGGSVFQFRAVKKTPTTTSQRRNLDAEFWIDDADRKKLVDEVNSVFDEELAKMTRFEFTDTKGEDVLMIRGGLHDIVSNVPPALTGRGEIYLSSVGEATLIIEGVDSMSGEVIFRAIERRAAQRPGGQGMMSNTVTTWAEVRRLARRWATTLREGLDAVPRE